MVKFVAYDQVELNHLLELGTIADTGPAQVSQRSPTGFHVRQGNVDFYVKGHGITYVQGYPWGGTLTSLLVKIDGANAYQFSGFSFSVQKAWDVLGQTNPMKAVAMILPGNDTLIGSAFDDTLYGFGGNDVIRGGGGDDMVFGGAGNDWIFGDGGADWMRGQAGIDTINGGAGVDTVDFADKGLAVTLILKGLTQSTAIVGGKLEDRVGAVENVVGGSAGDRLTGDANGNRLDGRGGNDVLKGAGGADTLVGGPGNDFLHGGTGNDVLFGGSGADRFVFDTALNAAANVDTIRDFVPGQDLIVLASVVFGLAAGPLGAGAFAIGAATTADHRVIYDDVTGRLYFDADGSGTGANPIQFAVLAGAPTLGAGNFLIA